MLKLVYARAADADIPLLPEKPLVPDEDIIAIAAEFATLTIREQLKQDDVAISPLNKAILEQWADRMKGRYAYASPATFFKEESDRAYFGYALFKGNQICAVSFNSLVERNRTARPSLDTIHTIDARIEIIEKAPLDNPLSGYTLACLSEVGAAYARLQGADQLSICDIKNPSILTQSPYLGFNEDILSDNDCVLLDIAGGQGIKWPTFLAFRNQRNDRTPCSPLPPSI